MDEREIETYIARVADDAERAFGRRLEGSLLELFAREAVLDLWLHEPGVTVQLATQTLDRIRAEFGRRAQLAA
jgi:hypothetical protein